MKQLVLLGALLFGWSAPLVFAQRVYGEPDIWFLFQGKYVLSPQWEIGGEVHLRFDDYLHDPQQLLLRPSISFQSGKKVKYSVGYTFIETYPYGAVPLLRNLPENNIWEQVSLKDHMGKWTIDHRYRLEQRWQGKIRPNVEAQGYQIDGYRFSHRFRYRLSLTHPIGQKYFVRFRDELWIRANESLNRVGFDRNWLYIGGGFKVNKAITIQLAWLHQYIRHSFELYEEHPTFQLSIDWRLSTIKG